MKNRNINFEENFNRWGSFRSDAHRDINLRIREIGRELFKLTCTGLYEDEKPKFYQLQNELKILKDKRKLILAK